MTDAQSPAKLSGPTRSNSSVKEAVEALPENGRVSKSGKTSAGTPSVFTIGERREESNSTAPDALSIETPTIKAQSVGKSCTAVSSPCRAPTRKESNRSFLPNKRMIPTAPRMSGIGRVEMKSIIAFLNDVCAKNAHVCAKTMLKATKTQHKAPRLSKRGS